MSRPLFLRKLRKYVAALPALAFGFMANPAFSTTTVIDASGITVGTSAATFGDATLTTSPSGTFTATTVGSLPWSVIGVSGGSVSNEIDIGVPGSIPAEKITLSFGSTGVVVNEITLGLLFRSSVTPNVVNEAAHLQTNAGTACASAICTLTATGVWRGAFTGVETLSPATTGNAGVFKVTNPFGSELINSIDFMPWAISGAGAANSDYGIVSVTYTTTVVPEPGTFVLVGLGVLGLAVAGSRRARA